jgi:preprotein translocase SecE subunit
MATAVKNNMETTAASEPQANLLRSSLVGAVYVTASLAVVLFGVPYVWKLYIGGWMSAHLGPFFDPAGMAVAVVGSAVGLLLLGLKLAGPHPIPGLRAGVFTFVVGGVLLFLIDVGFGQLLENSVIKDRSSKAGLIVVLAAGIGLVVLVVRYALSGALDRLIVAFDGQGWFSAKPYKANQGLWVRRGTLVGLLTIIGTGVWTLYDHKSLSGDWKVRIPYSEGLFGENMRLVATLLPDIRYTVPLLLVAVGFWFSWRAVNFPSFADFLIATEAELNKVSWSNRKRLTQDTIVVLVTLILFAVFLLLIDQLWGWLLTRETLGGIVPKPVPRQTRDISKDLPW